MDILETVVIEPQVPAKAAVIWLHGLGADGHDFEGIIPELGLPKNHHIRFVFPHAPIRPVTLNNNFPMRAWFDIYELKFGAQEDKEGIMQASQHLTDLAERQHFNGIAYENMIFAGFSQGASIALHCGLRFPKKLAGMLALSTYLPLSMTLTDEASEINKTTPIWMAHGTQDPVLPLMFGHATFGLLSKLGYDISWQEYPMQHAVCYEEIKAIGQWLTKLLC